MEELYSGMEMPIAAGSPRFWRQPESQDSLRLKSDLARVGGKTTDRLVKYQAYEDYYNGDQRARLLDRAIQYLQQVTGVKYAENVCDIVVDAMADRLMIRGWSTESQKSDSLNDAVHKVWADCHMDETALTVVTRTIELGDGFLVVDYDDECSQPTMSFNSPKMMKAEYDPANPETMLYAVKRWTEDAVSAVNPSGSGINRMNIYYNDRVERYFCVEEDGEWMPYFDYDDEYWPVPWTRNNQPPVPVTMPDPMDEESVLLMNEGWMDAEGRGIPVFHFKNRPRGFTYGRSELHKVIPMQNSLNKLWLDFFEIADHQGFPQRHATGVGNGESANWTAGAGIVWTSPQSDAKFGQFDAADLNQIANAIDLRYKSISGTTHTPFHMLVMLRNIPSGEALVKGEAGLVSKVKKCQPHFGHRFAQAMEMALTLMVDNDQPVQGFTPGETRLRPIWTPAENVDENEQLASAVLKRNVGIPLEIVLEELGYDNIPDIMTMVREEQQVQLATKLAEYQANRGGQQAQQDGTSGDYTQGRGKDGGVDQGQMA